MILPFLLTLILSRLADPNKSTLLSDTFMAYYFIIVSINTTLTFLIVSFVHIWF